MKTQLLLVILAASSGAQLVASSNARTTNFFKQLRVAEDRHREAIESPEWLSQSPQGGVAPVVPQHVKKWSAESKVPKSVQWALAGAWVCMLGSLPFVLRAVDKKPITKSQIVVGVLMLTVLLGGFALFTNIILFQSVHFDRVRPLTVVECIYFMTQVITTVGYGDVTPAKIRGQVFVGLYVLGALFIIAMLISDLTRHMVLKAQEYKERLRASRADPDEQAEGPVAPKTVLSLITPQKPSLAPLFTALSVFATIDLIWVLFFSLHPGEGKTVFQAVYMSVITLSTVGFGYFTPLTEEGMIFGSFFMLFGAGALGNVISQFTLLMVQLNQYERFRPEEESAVALEALQKITGGTGQVTEANFLQFTLTHLKIVDKKELDKILDAFQNLSPKEGSVSVKAIEESLKET